MLKLVVPAVLLLALTGCNSTGGDTSMSMAPAASAPAAAVSQERPATKAEIEAIAVGRTVSGSMRYAADGRYTYNGANPGKYRITEGRICVNFDNGQSRCDRIVTDGSEYILVNSSGRRFPFA